MLKEITKTIQDTIKSGLGSAYDVRLYGNELSSKEDIESLAMRARAIPTILVNVGSFDVVGSDSSLDADDLTIPIEIILVVSNLRSQVEQKDAAFIAALRVHKLLKGEQIGTSHSSVGYIDGGTLSEIFNFKGFAAYSMSYSVNLSVDLDLL